MSPETVGSILQKIVDILATAGTQANLDIINKLARGPENSASALTALSQGQPTAIMCISPPGVNLYTAHMADLAPIQIQQATTERAEPCAPNR